MLETVPSMGSFSDALKMDPRVDLILEGQIRQLLFQRKSFSEIVEEINKRREKKNTKKKVFQVKRRMEKPIVEKKKWKKMTQEKVSILKEMTEQDDPITHRQMASELGISTYCVRYHLKHTLGVKIAPKIKVHQLNEDQKKKRKERGPKVLQMIAMNLSSLFTCDESLFQVPRKGAKRNVHYVNIKRRKGERRVKRYFEREERFTKNKVMVWCGVTFSGKSELVFIESKQKINSKIYKEKCVDHFVEREKKKLFSNRKFLWHHDSAPCHTSNETISHMQERGIRFITREEWMPKSPDLCLMDFFVLPNMKKKVKESNVKNVNELKEFLKKLWDEIPQQFIQNAFMSWPWRIKRVIEANSGHI